MSQTPDGGDTQPIDSPRPPGSGAQTPEPDVPPSTTAGYAAAPAPGESDVTRPDLGDPQGPDPAEAQGAAPSTEAPDPAAAARRSRPRPVVIVAIVVGVLMVIAIVVGGLWLLSSNRTTDAPGDDSSAGSEPTSDDAGSEAPASACTDELCTRAEATVGEAHVSSDGVEWALDGSWSDVVDAPADAAGSGTAVYTSDAGTVTLTVVGFDDADQAEAYAEDVMAQLGEPYDTRVVWDDPPEGRDAGELNRFSDDVETAVWYDSSGQVWTLEGAPGTEPPAVFGFYYTLPPV